MDINKEPLIVMMKGSENGGCAFGNFMHGVSPCDIGHSIPSLFPTKPVLQGPRDIMRVGSRYKDGQKQREPKLLLRLSENGGYLLSHDCSTIGVAELNDPVRNGKGWDLSAITT